MALTPDQLAQAFEAACRAELDALKPGNVHRFAAGHGMEVRHFEAAAAAAAPAIVAPDLKLGARIAQAVEASLAAAGCNTNLGIILLCAPLAAAALSASPAPLRERLALVLEALDVEDAEAAFGAIAQANPGGLGDAPEADVHVPAAITLKEAMAMAADRDRIAWQYVRGFEDIFALGVTCLSADPLAPDGLEAAYLAFLCAFADSHLVRKFGTERAEAVRQEAIALASKLTGLPATECHAHLLAFDTQLKAQGLNPGTSADLTVASAFAAAILKAEGTAGAQA